MFLKNKITIFRTFYEDNSLRQTKTVGFDVDKGFTFEQVPDCLAYQSQVDKKFSDYLWDLIISDYVSNDYDIDYENPNDLVDKLMNVDYNDEINDNGYEGDIDMEEEIKGGEKEVVDINNVSEETDEKCQETQDDELEAHEDKKQIEIKEEDRRMLEACRSVSKIMMKSNDVEEWIAPIIKYENETGNKGKLIDCFNWTVSYTSTGTGLTRVKQEYLIKVLKLYERLFHPDSIKKNKPHISFNVIRNRLHIINTMYDIILKEHVQECICYTITSDGTPVNHNERICIVVRMFFKNNSFIEHKLTLNNIYKNSTANNICDFIIKVLNNKDFKLGECVGITSDGAANMKGRLNGACVQLKEKIEKERTNFIIEFINIIHCMAHRTNLSTEELCSCKEISSIIEFSSWFFLNTVQKKWCFMFKNKRGTKAPKKSLTRWSYISDTVSFIKKNYTNIIRFLKNNNDEEFKELDVYMEHKQIKTFKTQQHFFDFTNKRVEAMIIGVGALLYEIKQLSNDLQEDHGFIDKKYLYQY